MTNTHKWEELFPEGFFAEMARAPIVYWSCGAMEEHGLHLALGTDWIQTYEVCLRAAEITGGIVFPQVPFAPAGLPSWSREELRSGAHEIYRPSLWVSRELCEALYVEMLESMADVGFKVCIALAGHAPADVLLREIEQEKGGRIADMLFYGGGTGDLLSEEFARMRERDPALSGHGCMWETSLVMAIEPGWADLARAERVVDAPFASQLQEAPWERLERIKDANAEYGERLLGIAVAGAIARARDLLERSCAAG